MIFQFLPLFPTLLLPDICLHPKQELIMSRTSTAIAPDRRWRFAKADSGFVRGIDMYF